MQLVSTRTSNPSPRMWKKRFRRHATNWTRRWVPWWSEWDQAMCSKYSIDFDKWFYESWSMNSLREQWNNVDSLGFLGGQTSHFYKGISVIIRITIYQLIACGVFHMGPWGTVDSTLGVRESTRTFSVSWTAQGPNSPNKTMAKLTRLQRLTLNDVYPEAQNSTNTPFLAKKNQVNAHSISHAKVVSCFVQSGSMAYTPKACKKWCWKSTR